MTGITHEQKALGEIGVATHCPVELPAYCLMTAAYNEQDNIGRTIEAVLAQTWLPKRWVIVSDASTDKTDEIIKSYADKHPFIVFLKMTREPGRSFGQKVTALRSASKLLDDVSAAFVGNLDADITLAPDYFETLLHCFDRDPSLGLAGGFVCESSDGKFQSRSSNRTYSVAHAAQLVRRQVYQQIGGYAGCRYGGEDWHAQTAAKMAGWHAESFPSLQVFHHRRTGEADNLLRDRFRLGRLDYCFGSYPLFEIFKCLQRLPERPFLIGGMLRLAGFFWCFLSGENRGFSPEFVAFLQHEQKEKLCEVFRMRSRAVDSRGSKAL
jgi:glycosyltransferase involved in cell wall biosynthesis